MPPLNGADHRYRAKKIRFLSDKSLDISKLGDISKNEFEPVAELRKMREQREKEAELERLMASRV